MKQNVYRSLVAVHCQEGSALLITLLIMTLLTSLAVEFAYEVYVDTSALSNWSNAQRSALIASSGQTLGASSIRDIEKSGYSYKAETILPVQKDFGDNTRLEIEIEDENSKFNINSIINPNGTTNESALSSLKKLLESLNIDMSAADLIADWIDPDHEPRLRDSEYRAKNTQLWSIDELLSVPGIENKTIKKTLPYLTVHSDGMININTAPLPVIVSMKDLNETLARRIIAYRETTPFEQWYDVQKVSGMETIGRQLGGKIKVKSSCFRITSRATVNNITRIIESVMDTSLKVLFWREI
ncbi:MAG: type II secretion system minor pseudopilin GspK [Nitrospirae bacterium]|nr:type II secretion system minor pseudopilin GspK [Nitrospirota bacterium]